MKTSVITSYFKLPILFLVTLAAWNYISHYHPTTIISAFPQIPYELRTALVKSPIIGYIIFEMFHTGSFLMGMSFDHVCVKKKSVSSDKILLALNHTYHLGWFGVPTVTQLEKHQTRILKSLQEGVPKGSKRSYIKYLMFSPVWAGVFWYLFHGPGLVDGLSVKLLASRRDGIVQNKVLLYTVLAFLKCIVGALTLAGLALARCAGQDFGTIRLVNFVRKCLKDDRIHHGRRGEQKWLRWLCL